MFNLWWWLLLLNYQCQQCKTCIESDIKCINCIDGKYLTSSNTCDECNSNCKTCNDSDTHCLSCYEGYDLLINNTCVLCTEPCKTCSDENVCSICIDNYFPLSGICYECNYNCSTTESDNCKCSTCDDGYYY